MKKAMLIFGVILLMSVGLLGCSPGGNSASSASQNELKICGMYVQEDSPENYIIFRDDWTYIVDHSPTVMFGEWGLGDDFLLLVGCDPGRGCAGYGSVWKIAENKLIDEDGGAWVKQ